MTTRTIELPVALPEAEDCARCAERLRETLGRIKGIAGVDLDLPARRLTVTYDPAILSLSSLEDRVRETGVTLARRYRHATLRLEGLHCPDCAQTVEHAVAHTRGVVSAVASFAAASLHVEYDADTTDADRIAAAVSRTGYRAVTPGSNSEVAVLRVPEMDCQDEVQAIEGQLRALPGVASWQVNLLERTLRVQFDPKAISADSILAPIRALGMSPAFASRAAPRASWQRDPLLISTAASGDRKSVV